MNPSGPLPPFELLRPAPWKMLTLLAISAALVWLAVAIAGSHPLLAWIGGGFFGLCALVALVALLPGATYLRLDADGIELRSLFRVTRWRWCDVVRFGPTRVGLHTTVGIDFADHVGVAQKLRQLNQGLTGFDGALPDTFGHSAADLALKLERWRNAHIRAA